MTHRHYAMVSLSIRLAMYGAAQPRPNRRERRHSGQAARRSVVDYAQGYGSTKPEPLSERAAFRFAETRLYQQPIDIQPLHVNGFQRELLSNTGLTAS